MKIFLVSNLYPSKKFPNFGTFVGKFADEISKCGAEITCKAVINRKTSNIIIKLFLYAQLYVKIIFYGLFKQYDILYAHYIAHTSIPIYIVSILRNKKIVLNAHGDDILPRTQLVFYFQKIIRKLLQKTALVVVPSDYFKQVFLSKFNFSENKVFISPSGGVNTDLFKKINNAKKQIGYSESDTIIGFVSRISYGKGWDLFVESFSRLKLNYPCIKAIIIGNGEENNYLKEKIASLPDIQFIEKIKHTQLPLFYSAFDLFVFPSKLKESLGLVGIEAMSCETPVIGSNIGGIPTFLKHGYNGYLFNCMDINDLSDKIELYLNSSKEHKYHLGINARKFACNYDSAKIMRELCHKLNELLNK